MRNSNFSGNHHCPYGYCFRILLTWLPFLKRHSNKNNEQKIILLLTFVLPFTFLAQDLTEGLNVNDFSPHLMQDVAKPDYLDTIIDPSFGTTIRRISDAGPGGLIVPMYSTVQAWNADESLMILYDLSTGNHQLLDGFTYEFIRELDDVSPNDLEEIFWDFNDPNVFYYPESQSEDFIKYTVDSQAKQTLVNLADISGCTGNIIMGHDIQMMSWDSDVFTFRCDSESAYSYRISTEELTTFVMDDVSFYAPSVAPSGERYYHEAEVYNANGIYEQGLNLENVEHSCIGKMTNGNDGYFAVAYVEGPLGGCIGDIIAHDLTTGDCYPIIGQSVGYAYPQSGVHISALSHKNTEGGWLVASMVGYDEDGQTLLDQELVIAKADEGNVIVCRIGHHRSDENEFNYWGEPHPVMSPTGTRILFASDWSGIEDGQSVDCYVVELQAYTTLSGLNETSLSTVNYKVIPNPVIDQAIITLENLDNKNANINIFDASGIEIMSKTINTNRINIDVEKLSSGIYYFTIIDADGAIVSGKFVKM